jgi:hypothetical protein
VRLKSVYLFLDVEEDREEAMKPSHFALGRSSPLAFELVARSVNSNAWANSLCCPECQITLNLHQPDEEQPSQLLGTCDGCSKWFFVLENDLELDEMLLFELPTAETIRAALVGRCGAHVGQI